MQKKMPIRPMFPYDPIDINVSLFYNFLIPILILIFLKIIKMTNLTI